MFLKLKHVLFAAAIGAAALTGAGQAMAMPMTSGPQINSEIVPVQFVFDSGMGGFTSWSEQRDGTRCRSRYGDCRHYHNGYYYETPWWTLPLIIGGALNQRHHYRNYRNSHVEWCMSRYRSYNWRTDTWLGNSGRRYRCNSPY